MRVREVVIGAALALAATSTTGVGLAAAEVPHPAPVACGAEATVIDATKVRSEPTTHSTAVGRLDKGEQVCSHGMRTGGTYEACGSKDDHWDQITFKGEKRYVASACLRA